MKTEKTKVGFVRGLLLLGMALMIPCYLFTAGNTLLAPWDLYPVRSRPVLLVLTACCLALLVVLMRAVGKHEAFFERHENRVLAGAAVFYFAVQMLMAQALRFVPITDLEQCFTAAGSLADTGAFAQSERSFIYFTRYPHNLGIVYLFSGIFRFFGLFGWADRLMQGILVCSLLFTLGLLASARLCKKMGGVKAEVRFLFLCATCLPFLYCTTELYTDAFSLAFPSMIVYSFAKAKEAETPHGKLLFALLFGVLSFAGAQLRFTSVIAAIACLIAALFDKRVRLTLLLFVLLALSFVAGGTAMNHVNDRLLGLDNIEKNKLPILHYVAMGLPVQVDEGYGRYGTGGWLIFSTSIEDPQERKDALLEEVIDRIYTVRYPHKLLHMMRRKNISTFGDGTFMLNEIMEGDAHEPDNLIKQVIFTQGKAYPAYYHLTPAMFAAQMLLACLACFQAVCRKDNRAAALFISLLGIFLFLCMWESRGRYFFQYEMLLLCAAAQARVRE